MPNEKTYLMIGAVLFLMFVPMVAAEIPMWQAKCDDGSLVVTLNMSVNETDYINRYTVSDTCTVMPVELFFLFQVMAFVFLVIGIFKCQSGGQYIIFPLAALILFLALSAQAGSIDLMPSETTMLINYGFTMVAFIHTFYVVFYIMRRTAPGEDDEET